jgi:hypothetical protein
MADPEEGQPAADRVRQSIAHGRMATQGLRGVELIGAYLPSRDHEDGEREREKHKSYVSCCLNSRLRGVERTSPSCLKKQKSV